MSVKSALESIKPDEKLVYNTEKLLRSRIGRKKFSLSKLVAAAACLPIVLGVLFLSFYVYNLPVSYISFDVNPSFELGINRFDRVVDVNYYNNDAKSLMSKKEVYLHKPAEAIDVIMAELDKKGYLPIDKSTTIAIAVNCKQPSDSNKLLGECTKNLSKYPERINVIGYTVTGQFREEADSLSISFGKLKLIKIIQQLDKAATVKDFEGQSITSITDYLSYLTSDEYTGADENIKNSVKSYIDSIKTKVDTDSKTNTEKQTAIAEPVKTAVETEVKAEVQTEVKAEVKTGAANETGAGNVTTDAAAAKATAEEEAAKATTDAAAAKAAAEEEAAKATTDAAAAKAAAEEEATKATTDAAAAKAAAEEEAAKATTDAAAAKAAAEEEAAKAATDAAAAKAAAEEEAAKAATDAAAAKAAAEEEAAKAATDAAAAQAAAEEEAAKAATDAAAAQAAAEEEKARAENEAAEAGT